ncbi:MAG: exosortase/archaeosortase family protein [Planctomycetaceae bacterium]|nr:exosortase/archaeosortase family protein [Planctomycetaceae bacterium]
MQTQPRSILTTTGHSEWACPDRHQRMLWTVVVAGVLVYVFRSLLAAFIDRWLHEPQYSHGFLVPLIAVGLGWYLRDRIPAGSARSHVSGVFIILFGMILHILAGYLFVEVADSLGLLLCIIGGAILIWGRRLVYGIWPALVFLGFMCPLPFQVERMLAAPLQLLGAREAAYYIQTCGIPAVARGSIILMGDLKLGVAEACSGMRMLTVFFAISAAAVIVSNRSTWEKMLILFSAIPIALICNISRIVATALAYHYFGQRTADLVFHDLSGWLMMPAAMALLYLELKILDWVFLPAPDIDSRLRTVTTSVLHSGPGAASMAK